MHPDKLYRYTQLKWGTSFVEEGKVYLNAAAKYADSSLTDAQRDNEHLRQLNLDTKKYRLAVGQPGEGHANALQNLTQIKFEYKVLHEGQFLRYNILCLSLTADSKFYKEFGADCVITFNNPVEFLKRLTVALKDQYPDYELFFGEVDYFDRKEFTRPATLLECCFMKDKNDYEWQTEYRVAVIASPEKASDEGIEVVLGDLRDICELTPKP